MHPELKRMNVERAWLACDNGRAGYWYPGTDRRTLLTRGSYRGWVNAQQDGVDCLGNVRTTNRATSAQTLTGQAILAMPAGPEQTAAYVAWFCKHNNLTTD